MRKCILICVFLWTVSFCLAQPLFGHDMWLQESGEGYDIVLGHQGQTQPYEPERVLEVTGYTKNGWAVQLQVERSKNGCRVIPDDAFCALTALLDNRYWLKTTDGWKNQREKTGLDIIQEGRSYKYTKHIANWCDFLAKPLGQRLEIVPLNDPTSLKEGEPLPVKIFFEGKPASGAILSKTSHMEKTHEDEPVKGEGPFMIIVGSPGLQLINTKFMFQVKEKQVIWFASSLTFYTRK